MRRLFCGILFLLFLLQSAGPRADDGSVALAEARLEANLAEAAAARAGERVRVMQADPDVPDEEVLAMERYVRELEELARLRRETVRDLERLTESLPPAPDPLVTEGMEAFGSAMEGIPDGVEPETEEERLQREFLASLEAFDELLASHRQKVLDQISQRAEAGSSAAQRQRSAVDEAEELLRSMGVSTGDEAETDDSGPAESPPRDRTAEVSETRRETETAGGAGGDASRRRSDEDIVARQLREAAENETDPELRERLWKEYEAYLDGR